MKIELPAIADAERTPLAEALLALIDARQQHIQRLEETVGQLRDEIAILKGQKPRPTIAPPTHPAPAGTNLAPGARVLVGAAAALDGRT